MDQTDMLRYAALVLDAGLGAGDGTMLRITGELPHRELMYVVAREAYRRGARLVRIEYDDPRLARIRADASWDAHVDAVSIMTKAESEAYVEEGWSFLRIEGYENPSVMAGADQERLTRMQRARGPAVKAVRDAQMASRLIWCVAPAPTEAWAAAVFGERGREADLWRALRSILRLDEADPAAALRASMDALGARAAALTARCFRELRFSGPGTELSVALSPDSIWQGGADRTPAGKVFMPNIPTEELFTTPDYRGTEGVVAFTRPVRLRGTVVEGGRLEFANGEVVSSSARSGAEALARFLETDRGARRLGEVAIVDASSPIWKTGLVFDSMLLDENAACHIALGSGYDPAFRGVEDLGEEEREARGFNSSIVHEDLMIGSEDVSVTGVDREGREVAVIVKGRFAG